MTANQTLVALTPQDVPATQSELVAWCRTRILALSLELREARQNLRAVKRLMLGSPKAWENVVRRTVAKMIYYAKIQTAVKAGYLVVPNFPAEIIAVRVNRARPPERTEDAFPSDINEARPDLNLPPGVGRYVDETNPHVDLSYEARIPDGKGGVTVQRHRLTKIEAYDETVDFPATLVQPVILAATERALALRLFDRIGVVNGGTRSRKRRRSDPIVVGQIIDGSVSRHRWEGDYPKYTTFFIAWWLDTKDL